jgi:hypothetical protein
MSNVDDFEKQVDIRVRKELEKEKFDKKLDTLIKSAEIYPDIIKSLSSLRKSVEALDKSMVGIGSNQEKHNEKLCETETDVGNMFDKVRDILDQIKKLESKLIDKNNSNSMIELITKMVEEQNNSMVNQNNPKSIVSLLKRSGRIQSWITWILITTLTLIGIAEKLIG